MRERLFISHQATIDDQVTAHRLHTLAIVHNHQSWLPLRLSEGRTTEETRTRIALSEYYLLFTARPLEAIIEYELEIARQRDIEVVIVTPESDVEELCRHKLSGLLLTGYGLLKLKNG